MWLNRFFFIYAIYMHMTIFLDVQHVINFSEKSLNPVELLAHSIKYAIHSSLNYVT